MVRRRVEKLGKERPSPLAVVTLLGEIDRRLELACGREARIDLRLARQRSPHQTRADQEDGGERDLPDDERVAKREPARQAWARGVLQGGQDVEATGARGGRQAEEERRKERGAAREGERARVEDPGGGADRQSELRRHRRGEQVGGPDGEKEAGRRAEPGEQETLHEELARELAARSAQREADADLAPTAFASEQQQSGGVGAGDEEDEAGHPEKEP